MKRSTLLRSLAVLVAFGAVSGAGALYYAWEPALPPIDPPKAEAFDPALVAKGAQLALLGDCRTCHSPPGGQSFAGGLPLVTPFGAIYSTNITPDPETGIGTWSQAAFTRAMREGVDRAGAHLYPAFPYNHFTVITDDDLAALYAYFMTRPPVVHTPPPNDLPFPVNIRLVLAGWNLFAFSDAPFAPDPSRDAQWNRGKYLVDGLGHCGACHTPRNLVEGESMGREFAGGQAEGWDAIPLGRHSTARVRWTEAALTEYLTTGHHEDHGVALGPMGPVTENLGQAPAEDVAAIAHYLASLDDRAASDVAAAVTPMGPRTNAPQSAGWQVAAAGDPADRGAVVFQRACAVCHESGRPVPLGGVDLAVSSTLTNADPTNLLRVILGGIPATGTTPAPIMPGFAAAMSDADLESLVTYLRKAKGDAPPWTGLSNSISSVRRAMAPAEATDQ